MKTAPPKAIRRPTASADRPGDAAARDVPGRAAPEPRCYAVRRRRPAKGQDGLFTGGETLH